MKSAAAAAAAGNALDDVGEEEVGFVVSLPPARRLARGIDVSPWWRGARAARQRGREGAETPSSDDDDGRAEREREEMESRQRRRDPSRRCDEEAPRRHHEERGRGSIVMRKLGSWQWLLPRLCQAAPRSALPVSSAGGGRRGEEWAIRAGVRRAPLSRTFPRGSALPLVEALKTLDVSRAQLDGMLSREPSERGADVASVYLLAGP